MQRLAVLTTLLFAATAAAQPPALSQHPRVGELCEIDFPAGSARILAPGATAELGEVAGWAKDNPDGLIVLDGFADRGSEGTPPERVRLSMQRAAAVRDELVSAGVDRDRIVVAGFGGDSGQRASAAQNRRVTVWVTHEDLDAVVARLDATGAFAIVWGNQQIPALATR